MLQAKRQQKMPEYRVLNYERWAARRNENRIAYLPLQSCADTAHLFLIIT
jgi:hypothetical protein